MTARWDADAQAWVEDRAQPTTQPLLPPPALPPPPVLPPPGAGEGDLASYPTVHSQETGPASPPYPAPGDGSEARRNRTRALTIALAMALVLAAGTGGYLLFGREDDGTRAASTQSPAPADPTADPTADLTEEPTQDPTSSPSPEETDPASPQGRVPPEGYYFMTEQDFLLVAPADWDREARNSITWYRSPENPEREVIQVWRAAEDVTTPLDLVELAENGDQGLSGRPGYEQHAKGSATDPTGQNLDSAELDYSWQGDNGGVRGLYRAIRMPDGALWVVLVSGPPESWPKQQEIQKNVLDYFCLTGSCPYEPVMD
ncbi:hypothetical protein ACFQLX_04285 [Streptomyces polyrhachis]|uniref:Serine/arginine repetitive matrix protein 2 n=1 Tax=Streptomyces polyrhachis TaxID=1282885 RepID=A0ABW2GF35_9ACTN